MSTLAVNQKSFRFLVESDPRKHERISTRVFDDSVKGSRHVARQIANRIQANEGSDRPTVLGLATGSSPTKIYDFLVQFHREEGLSFANVVTFNLDEYYPMEPTARQSYVRFMHEHLFDHIDIPAENIHIPDGTLEPDDIKAYCQNYEAKIKQYGGLDIQLLGIGRTGHVGFNEPGSSADSKTRPIRLDKITRLDAASDFYGEEYVPPLAITMGVSTILNARQIYLVAWGEGKAPIIRRTVEGDISDSVPATFLQGHPQCEFILDEAAASSLTRYVTPWLVQECDWNPQLIRSACVWLSGRVGKAILKLTNEDYNENGLGTLVAEYGSAEDINLIVFNQLQRTITGWPGGKPKVDDSKRPERNNPFPKRSIIFSPHPDDDVISMGGTFLRLVDQGHEVHVAYQTSGNIAVFDDEVLRYLDFAEAAVQEDTEVRKRLQQLHQDIRKEIKNKKTGDIDSPTMQRFKAVIRRGEALAGCRYCGLDESNAHFLDMPFYETGTIKKNPLGEEDIQIIYDLLQKIKPHQIFAAGDLSDPHGTHRVCLDAIFRAVHRLRDEKAKWLKDTYVWLYRGAWQEWDISDIDMAIPIGPRDVMRKRKAIFQHQSQKDTAMFPGTDEREFWQRAEDRNRDTANRYNNLGLAEYEAMEAFKRWEF
ncbi:MAG: glucosamine-6-phosphate deaminase [Bacteroidota bacterium]